MKSISCEAKQRENNEANMQNQAWKESGRRYGKHRVSSAANTLQASALSDEKWFLEKAEWSEIANAYATDMPKYGMASERYSGEAERWRGCWA